MSRRNSKANLKKKPSQGSGEIRIHFESGETYRPFTDIERIAKIDAKKQSKDDPRLSNVSKDVPRDFMMVFSINKTPPEAMVNQSSIETGDSVKIEQCEPSLSSLPSKETLPETFGTHTLQEFSVKPDLGFPSHNAGNNLVYSADPSQYLIPHFQHEAVPLSNDNAYGSLAISIDTVQSHSANTNEELTLVSATGTPLSGFPYPFVYDGVESPTSSFSGSSGDDDQTTYENTFCGQQSTLVYQGSPMLSNMYPIDGFPLQYPELVSSTEPVFTSFGESSESVFNLWSFNQKLHISDSEQVGLARHWCPDNFAFC